VLVGAHAAGDAVEDDADALRGHEEMAGLTCRIL
jgi:hypothetical protein